MEAEVLKLADGKLSVRLDEQEVFILPKKSGCTIEDLEDAVKAVVKATGDGEWE